MATRTVNLTMNYPMTAVWLTAGGKLNPSGYLDLTDAIERARKLEGGTYVTVDGERVAAILPADAGEAFEKLAGELGEAANEAIAEAMADHDGQNIYGAIIPIEATGSNYAELVESAQQQAASFFGDVDFKLFTDWRAEISGGAYRAMIEAAEVLSGD